MFPLKEISLGTLRDRILFSLGLKDIVVKKTVKFILKVYIVC